MKIGENSKTLRKARGFTQEQLADMLGLSFQAVSKWETNANTPDISLLPTIAKVLGTSIDQLFSESNPELWEGAELIKNDDVIRIVQLQGHRVLKTTPVNQSFSIVFPRDCNNETQYFKVEVFGHVIADGSSFKMLVADILKLYLSDDAAIPADHYFALMKQQAEKKKGSGYREAQAYFRSRAEDVVKDPAVPATFV